MVVQARKGPWDCQAWAQWTTTCSCSSPWSPCGSGSTHVCAWDRVVDRTMIFHARMGPWDYQALPHVVPMGRVLGLC